jgi:hypothetical protein
MIINLTNIMVNHESGKGRYITKGKNNLTVILDSENETFHQFGNWSYQVTEITCKTYMIYIYRRNHLKSETFRKIPIQHIINNNINKKSNLGSLLLGSLLLSSTTDFNAVLNCLLYKKMIKLQKLELE